jgi:predicted DNA-binding transcriptional regulator AlpA
MLPSPNRHARRRDETLRRRGFDDDEIAEAPDREAGGDPLFDARRTQEYVGGISAMTLWRWAAEHAFPKPDAILSRRRFWKRSTLDKWIAAQVTEQSN